MTEHQKCISPLSLHTFTYIYVISVICEDVFISIVQMLQFTVRCAGKKNNRAICTEFQKCLSVHSRLPREKSTAVKMTLTWGVHNIKTCSIIDIRTWHCYYPELGMSNFVQLCLQKNYKNSISLQSFLNFKRQETPPG